ncbi:gamma-glutamyl phosphate reductase GPR [Gonapodya prolifera JEL478]|uniref:glutamate-5-semialdehyde dehydrogenase n=1 Tax=Gonapodya prolifera (strain JEL478) TaxID=1344416 RepID=A0A138ZXJ2_GONPJ|nr:gamma-glutamyl phosphate reductase GPR [Gonapodya prolifera JEL478]|eukprot:KXS09222.1 gamma-glutamyl phosphate reductase GPR [Gonapodya prolifera JEL478]
MTVNGANGIDTTLEIARAARGASLELQAASLESKSLALHRIAEQLLKDKETLRQANQRDLDEARARKDKGELSEALFKRLDLFGPDGSKFETLLEGVKDVDKLADPTGQVTYACKLDDGLDLYRVTCPVGVLLIIFESRPEVVVQISTLAIKSGNAVILKGGREAAHSNAALHASLTTALSSLPAGSGVPPQAIQLVSTRDEIAALLKLDEYIDLAIPRGSNEFVRYVKDNTRIPVLGHADGLCSIYLDESADTAKAVSVVVDGKTNYPAACNAAETLLVHENALSTVLPEVARALWEKRVQLRCDTPSHGLLSQLNPPSGLLREATPEDFRTEFLELVMAVRTVPSFADAISHINTHGSHHTECIVTENQKQAEEFMRKVDAAGVYWNASTRLADGFRYGFGAEIGVSTNKTHARGPVGLEGLVIYKYKVYGSGQGAGMYGPSKKKFLHEVLDGREELQRRPGLA